MMKSYPINSKKVLLTGFSMGGEGTWYLAGRHQDLFTAAIPIAGAPDNTVNWSIPLLAIHSTADTVLPYAKTAKHVENLKNQGAPVELLTVTNHSHYKTDEYTSVRREMIDWLRKAWK
jgi:predicted peptidase